MSFQPQDIYSHTSPHQQQFVLDGRLGEFPNGLKTSLHTHTMHRFPGKFVPQVVRELLLLVGAAEHTLIADPFSGSGTSLVEASLSGVPSVGVDCDPLAVLICQAKTTALSPRQLSALQTYWADPIGLAPIDDMEEAVPNLYHWFKPSAARQLAFIREKALALDDEQLRTFSLVVFSSIIRRVSNADDQTQKTYVSGTLRKTPPLPSDLFPLFLERAIRGMVSYASAKRAPVVVEKGDARTWRSSRTIDGIITSPPYIDSIDYVYNQLLEYFWLHNVLGLESMDEIRALRKEPVGFRRADIVTGFHQLSRISPKAADLLEAHLAAIQSVSEKEAQSIVGYFMDFAMHLEVTNRNMKRGGIYALVVGESNIRGVTIPTPAILAELFDSSGFEDMGYCSYVIKRHSMKFPRRLNSGKIKLDHVHCFRST